jgi:mRNA interferase RelE/StbE
MAKQPYAVVFAKAADRQLRKLPKNVQQRIVLEAESLSVNPRPVGSIKLEGEDELYRIRVGDYRVIYQIGDEQLIVLIVRIAHRKDAYRNQ